MNTLLTKTQTTTVPRAAQEMTGRNTRARSLLPQHTRARVLGRPKHLLSASWCYPTSSSQDSRWQYHGGPEQLSHKPNVTERGGSLPPAQWFSMGEIWAGISGDMCKHVSVVMTTGLLLISSEQRPKCYHRRLQQRAFQPAGLELPLLLPGIPPLALYTTLFPSSF